jgi:hypothetical protein
MATIRIRCDNCGGGARNHVVLQVYAHRARFPESGVIPPAPPPRRSGVGRASQAAGPAAGIARGGQARFPGLRNTSTRQTMPTTHSAAPELASLLDGSSAGELIPELARHGLQQLIELELAAFLGADWHERTEERLGHRNGYRPRSLTTQVGDLALQIPKRRSGSFLPSILEPRRRVDQALYAVIMEAYIGTPEKAIRCLNANFAIERRESRSHACLYRDQ